MFCPLCGERLANPSNLNQPDGKPASWSGTIAPSCPCGATFTLSAKCKEHVIRFAIEGFGPAPDEPDGGNRIAIRPLVDAFAVKSP